MRVRALDSNGDITFGSGTSNYKTGAQAVAQNIQTRLNMFANDCFFSMTGWIDWINIQGSTQNQTILELFITNIIASTPYVYQIQNFSVIVNGRSMTASYTVLTAFGVVSTSNLQLGVPTSYLLTESGDVLTTETGSGLIT